MKTNTKLVISIVIIIIVVLYFYRKSNYLTLTATSNNKNYIPLNCDTSISNFRFIGKLPPPPANNYALFRYNPDTYSGNKVSVSGYFSHIVFHVADIPWLTDVCIYGAKRVPFRRDNYVIDWNTNYTLVANNLVPLQQGTNRAVVVDNAGNYDYFVTMLRYGGSRQTTLYQNNLKKLDLASAIVNAAANAVNDLAGYQWVRIANVYPGKFDDCPKVGTAAQSNQNPETRYYTNSYWIFYAESFKSYMSPNWMNAQWFTDEPIFYLDNSIRPEYKFTVTNTITGIRDREMTKIRGDKSGNANAGYFGMYHDKLNTENYAYPRIQNP
jgi:hypothetical protein